MSELYENKDAGLYCRDSSFSKKPLSNDSHLHYQIELVFLKSGHARATIDSRTYDVRGGDVVIIFPNQLHCFDTLEREQYILMTVNPDMVAEIILPLLSGVPESNVMIGGAFNEDIALPMQKISDTYYSCETYKEQIIRGYLLVLFGKLISRISIKESKEPNVLGIILKYCTNNYTRPLSLDILEKDLHISKYYISHTISSKLHMGFNDYINSLRISAACKYLLKTDKSITEISDLVGFNTMRTFNRAFQKRMGMTPSKYREKMG